MRSARGIILVASAALALAQAAAAQPDRRPDAARRIVAYFDFEERRTNPEPIPMGWRVDQDRPERDRPGFPIYNLPALDYAVAAEGEGSVRLPTRGGSTSLVVETGVIPVFPEADYLVTCQVRTEGLTHARAFVEASMLDAQGRVIEGSRRRSRPINGSAWTHAEVSLRGDWPDAAFVRLELLVLQAEHHQPDPPGYGRVWPMDVSGAAWFDSVGVIQQPRITLTTGAPGNIVTAPEGPILDILARDTAGQRLDAVTTLYDISGAVVASAARTIDAGRWQERWRPGLDRFGWYRCVVEIYAEGDRIGWEALDLAWLPPSGAVPLPGGSEGLGVVLTTCPQPLISEVVRAARALGAEHLSLPVWSAATDENDVHALARELARALDDAGPLRGRIALTMPRLPDALAEALGLRSEQVLRALTGDPNAWAAYLDPLLDRFGQSVGAWQVGQVGDESAMALPDLAGGLERVRDALARLVPGPRIVVPWRADRAPPEPDALMARGARFAVLVPASFAPEGVRDVVSAWSPGESGSAADHAGSFLLEPFDLGAFGARAAVIDTALRAIFAWAGSPGSDPTLALLDPFVGGQDSRSPLMPRPDAAALLTLRQHLRGRAVVGELDVGDGLRCLVLAPRSSSGDDGALVAWRESADPQHAAIDLMLALTPVRVHDLFGNSAVVRPIEQTRAGLVARRHRIPLTDMPVFIEGIDVSLARLQSSFRIEPGLLQARGTPRDLDLVLTNPWPTTMAGRAVIVEPGGSGTDGARDRSWRIEPRTFDFEAAPGQEARMPLSVLMREFEEAGPKRWVIDLRLAGREDLGWITVSAPLMVGLEGIDLRISTRVIGADLSVEIAITNTRDEAVLLDATVFAPTYPRERRSIGEVLPRTQVTRRFFYEGGAARLTGQPIVASVRETETGARLNASARVP